jgi:hypothetical protein
MREGAGFQRERLPDVPGPRLFPCRWRRARRPARACAPVAQPRAAAVRGAPAWWARPAQTGAFVPKYPAFSAL